MTNMDVTKPAKVCILPMWISCAKSVGCIFVARSKLVPATYYSYCDSTYLCCNIIVELDRNKNFESDMIGFGICHIPSDKAKMHMT